MIRSVVFDFDGTLVDSNRIKRQAFFDLASEFEGGEVLMAHVMEESSGRDRYWVFDRFAAGLPIDVDAAGLAERYTLTCEDRIVRAPETAGAAESLDRLKAMGKRLFVNSATPSQPLRELLVLRGMDHLFDGTYGGPVTKLDNLRTIAKRHGLEPAEILVVGDGESDRESAEVLQCHFVAVMSDGNDFARSPPRWIPDLATLPEAVFDIDRS